MSSAADFISDRTTPSPAQFDTSNSVATMLAVQRALGNFAGGSTYTANKTLTAANAGNTSFFNSSSALSCVLPLLSTCPVGTAFPLENGGSGIVTISTQGADALYFLGSGVNGSKTMGGGDTAHVVNIGTGSWVVIGGSIQHGQSSVYGAVKSASGYQKLPSGLIIQWGSAGSNSSGVATFTLPIVFPTALLCSVADYVVSGTGLAGSPITGNISSSSSASQLIAVVQQGASAVNGGQVNFLAVGY